MVIKMDQLVNFLREVNKNRHIKLWNITGLLMYPLVISNHQYILREQPDYSEPKEPATPSGLAML
jgi:hypothetical protein